MSSACGSSPANSRARDMSRSGRRKAVRLRRSASRGMARSGVIRAVSGLLRCPERYAPERGGANADEGIVQPQRRSFYRKSSAIFSKVMVSTAKPPPAYMPSGAVHHAIRTELRLPEQHAAGFGQTGGLKAVEVDTAGHGLPGGVTTTPCHDVNSSRSVVTHQRIICEHDTI